ncbi:hypothetical protein HEK616_47870 [Streptomyces nigrescens]|uniref:Amidohydrolase family protein n=1 Tax=Streptomyces nigrescens TaxID=1920 RepID=A0ABN6R2K0_STRNI|nr:hypothetical protein HEK616_47870 [Streptomyces nigrescens]
MVSRTVVRGGLVITAADEVHADVLVEDGRIAALAAHGSPTADRTPGATGKYVIPGGVGAHTHLDFPFGGTASSDTFETGTRAAAWGGTTTLVDFAVRSRLAPTSPGHDRLHHPCPYCAASSGHVGPRSTRRPHRDHGSAR